MKKHIIGLLVVLSITSCTKYKKNKLYHIKHVNDIECNNIPFNVTQVRTQIDTNLHKAYFTYFNSTNNTLGIFFIKKQYSKNIPIPLNIIKRRRENTDFYVYSFDSIFYFDRKLSSIFLFDTTGNIIDKFPINSNFQPSPINSFFFLFSKKLFYSLIPLNIDTKKQSSIKHAISRTKPICSLDITKNYNKDTRKYFLWGDYPVNYQKGYNYYNYSPNIFIGLHNEIISCFASSHNIFVYQNEKLIITKKIKSNFIHEFKYIPDDKSSNISYCRTFLGEEPKYINLITDPYKDCYYRVAKLRFKIGETDIKKAKWSIIIIDKSFNIVGEVLLNYSDYLPDIIIPSKDGLFIKKSPSSKKEFTGNLKLSLIQFIQ